MMNRNKLYWLLSTACLAGYIWIAMAYRLNSAGEFGGCIIKRLTNIPCPSCGSTRSVLMLLNGDIAGSINLNPFGLLILSFLLIAPFWILYDLIKKKKSLFLSYNRIESLFKRRWIAILAVLLVLANWIWNVYKNL